MLRIKIKRRLFIAICIIYIIILISIAYFTCASMNHNNHINIENYPISIDYGILSNKQIETFNNILNAVENQNNLIDCPEYSKKEKHEILTQLGLYYGSAEEIGYLIGWDDKVAVLNLNMFNQLTEHKKIIDARIDEALSSLNEGTDEYKLWQISNYIAKKMKYTKGYRDTISALNGKGVCNGYTMLFYKMATRIGIKTYVCYGYAGDGYHVWNMTKLNNNILFYDITWYDGILYNIMYIESKTSWGRNFQINNRWSTDLK